MGFFNQLKKQVAHELKKSVLGNKDPEPLTKEAFEESKPDELRKDIRMISGCADHQTSADVSNVSNFCLPGEFSCCLLLLDAAVITDMCRYHFL